MRAITLWEPWGTAIALGLKANETRGWDTDWRGALAIHGAKTRQHAEFIRDPSVESYFQSADIFRTTQLAFGCVLAVATLRDVVPVESIRDSLTPMERAFGNYEDGRFAWLLSDVRRLKVPVPFIGQRKMFDIPAALLR